MKRLAILIFLLMLFVPLQAQEPIPPITPIPPPADHMESCQGENGDLMLYYFGPLCLNPVYWDVDGFRRIGTWAFFTREDGSTDGGVVVGFIWQFEEGRYYYWLMTQMPNPAANFGGRFEHIAPERLL